MTLQAHRCILGQPEKVGVAGVRLIAEPVTKLVAQSKPELTQPEIVLAALSCPDGAWMILIPDRLVAPLPIAPPRSRGEVWNGARRCRGCQDPMSRIEKLTGLEDHLDNMLITMPARTARRLMGQIEDIHLCLNAGGFCLNFKSRAILWG